MFLTRRLAPFAVLLTAVLLGGCDKSQPADKPATAPLPEELFLGAAPDDPRPIHELKQSTEPGDEVTVRAVIGGRVDPIVRGRASATIVDAEVNNTCLIGDDHCKTPWDYCCEPRERVTANMATLQVVDADGRVVEADLASRLPPLSTVVARGIVGPRPTSEALTINATGVYVETRGRP